MKKPVFYCTIAMVLVLMTFTACQPGDDKTSSTTPISESITLTIEEAADDVIPTPGGWAYRANVHQQGIVNPWPPVQTVEVVLGDNDNATYLTYRDYIETKAGETRNNIFHVRIPAIVDIGNMNLEISNLPDEIEVTQGNQFHGPLGNSSKVLAIEIAQDIQLGEYTFEIGLEINGKDYGTVPCTINIVE